MCGQQNERIIKLECHTAPNASARSTARRSFSSSVALDTKEVSQLYRDKVEIECSAWAIVEERKKKRVIFRRRRPQAFTTALGDTIYFNSAILSGKLAKSAKSDF